MTFEAFANALVSSALVGGSIKHSVPSRRSAHPLEIETYNLHSFKNSKLLRVVYNINFIALDDTSCIYIISLLC